MSVLPPPPGEGDDERPRADGRPVHHVPSEGDLPPLPPGIEIPDDLSMLDDEVDVVRRALQREQRAARVDRLPILRLFRGKGIAGPLVVASLLALVLMGTLLMTFPPAHETGRPIAAPLASPTAAVGTRGGLLPDVTIEDTTGRQVSARALRPAVLSLVPAGCACAQQLRQVAGQAKEFALLTVFVESPKPMLSEPATSRGSVSPRSVSMAELSTSTGLSGYVDPSGQLTALAGGNTAPVLLVVDTDGTLVRGPLPYHSGDRLEQVFADMTH